MGKLGARKSTIQKGISFLKRQKIAYKIALGYGFSMGIALLGVGMGLTIGAFYEEVAARDRDAAVLKAELVTRLENDTLTLTLHPQHLITAMDQSLWLRYEIAQFKSDIEVLRLSITKLEDFLASAPKNLKTQRGVRVRTQLRIFLDDYQRWIGSLWGVLDAEAQTATAGKTLVQRRDKRLRLLVMELSRPEAKTLQIQLEQLAEQLTMLVNAADRKQEAASQRFEAARRLELWLVFGSFLMSLVLAIACGVYISQAIARPIREVTAQAQRITEEENFDLRVAVDTGGETAQLATSIDQLVRWAGQYTHELELAQATLEQRVEERTEALRTAQAQMVQSEKMSSLGQMVAGVAHEINNPVGFIYSNISYATSYVEDLLALIKVVRDEFPECWDSEAIAEQVDEIDLAFLEKDVMKVLGSMQVGADRIKEIVLSLRTFSRLDEAELKHTDLQEGLESTLTILGHRLKASPERVAIEVVRDYGALPLVKCYAGQLNQVFMNLIANAIDALEEALDAGHPPFPVDEQDGGDIQAPPTPRITIATQQKNHQCVITVSDNGPGIPAEVCDRIFDPFFTTKPVGKGTGMGLAISYQIVTDKHGGQLTCTSAPDQGTTFTIQIPTNHGRASRASQASRAKA